MVNHVLIAANFAVFIAFVFMAHVSPGSNAITGHGPIPDEWTEKLGLIWNPSQWWRFVTYAFVHGGWSHILGNMLFLFVFGPSVEDRLGRIGYLGFYLLGGAAAGAAHVAFTDVPAIGASGAIAAVTGAFLVFFPRTNVRLFVFFIMVGMLDVPAVWFIGVAIARDFVDLGASDQVSHAAHLGGYAFGIVVAFVLLFTKVVPREGFDLLSVFKRKRRLAEIRDATKEFDPKGVPARVRSANGRKAASTPEPVMSEEVAAARAEISSRVARGDAAGAASGYMNLLRMLGTDTRFATLNRGTQLAVANQLFAEGAHEPAALAYTRFLDVYPTGDQSPHVRLMLGLLYARYLGEAARARELVMVALPALREEEDRTLANQLLAEIGTLTPKGM